MEYLGSKNRQYSSNNIPEEDQNEQQNYVLYELESTQFCAANTKANSMSLKSGTVVSLAL